MKDPHVHVEKTPLPGFGHVAMRSLITEATGLVPDLPKTVGTWCGVRRPIAMTSTIPETVTCLACRERAAADYRMHADDAEHLLALYDVQPELMARAAAAAKVTPEDIAEEAQAYQDMAARLGGTP